VRAGVGKIIADPPVVKLLVTVEESLVALLYTYVSTYAFGVHFAYKVKLLVCPCVYGNVIALPPLVADQPAKV
jgi:hypothetical protein